MVPGRLTALGKCRFLHISLFQGTLVIFPLQGTLLGTEGPQRTLNQNLELRFQYSEDGRQQWFVVYTKQVSSQDGA